jgi:hypothetical protein
MHELGKKIGAWLSLVLGRKEVAKMMKRTRKLCCTLLILGFMLPQVMGSTADAASGTWKHNRKGWWYSYSDGSYAKNEWFTM